MPSLLVVGGDHLGNIEEKLANIGFDTVIHITGRKSQTVKKGIPENIDLVLVLTDYINHNLSKVIKQKAKEQSLPICFAKRSWCSICQVLESCKECPLNQAHYYPMANRH
ncbi:DUF2325 domain-containing protein [Microaerobacter geothermalis]|uniref:DUF2325 domain-containing protein n=1 Tax=Microaerobacter geothermalis TaxID=674972 RepID=UPI001F394AB1|nr:DUF2325 domain-containing protein [Microaerobacter geothermalis]MCF6093734.1 DUF2325 domain-containing protein [Microaerobacter geothermalis]